MTAILLADILLPPSDKIVFFLALMFSVTIAELLFSTASLKKRLQWQFMFLHSNTAYKHLTEARGVLIALYQKEMGRASKISAAVISSQT